jgi:hypothetical protein
MSSFFSRPVWQPDSVLRPDNPLEPGTFVAFSISTEGTAQRFMHPSCSKARENIRKLQPEVYIGMINSSVVYHPVTEEESKANGGRGRIEISIAPIGKCPPTAVFLKSSDIINPELLSKPFEDLCLPVSSEEDEEVMEEARVPLQANQPFPWSSCFIYTTSNINGVVGNLHSNMTEEADGQPWQLNQEWLDYFDHISMQDDWILHEARLGSYQNPRQKPAQKPCGSRECACWSQVDCKETGTEIANDQFVLDIWLDLEIAHDVEDPHKFHKEWVNLNKYVKVKSFLFVLSNLRNTHPLIGLLLPAIGRTHEIWMKTSRYVTCP